MSKNYVLDTNVLISDPRAIYKFQDNNIFLPMEVIEELDKLKTENNTSRGKASREATRAIAELIKGEDSSNGVDLPNGGFLFIPIFSEWTDMVSGLDPRKKDNLIIMSTLELRKNYTTDVILVSNDTNVRVKATALGIPTQEYKNQKVELNDQYTGWKNITLSKERCFELQDMKSIEIEGQWFDNEYALISNPEDSTMYIGRYDKECECLRHISSTSDIIPSQIAPLNIEQRLALDALLDPKVNLVTITGGAGSGKTLLSIAVGLYKVLESKEYSKVLVSRPVVSMGQDIGFLPGGVDDKMSPWIAPIHDSLEYITENAHKQNLSSVEQLMKTKVIQIEALTYIRGRSLPKQFMIIDEAQNLTPHEVKTIVTRAGEGTKMVFVGDVEQVDTPYLDSTTNGLVGLVEAFKDEKVSAHVYLTKTERSALAERAVKLL